VDFFGPGNLHGFSDRPKLIGFGGIFVWIFLWPLFLCKIGRNFPFRDFFRFLDDFVIGREKEKII
jgi:hypothetical protein